MSLTALEVASRAERCPVSDVAAVTDLKQANRLSTLLGPRVLLKREDQQPVHSFKLRGAYVKMRSLALAGARQVCAASAGNHAQGVALAATALGIRATIFMPVTTPSIKVEAVSDLGAVVRLHGDNFDQAQHACTEYATAEDIPTVHPFDDNDVICGQATIGLEICQQLGDAPHRVFVPVGGGGLIAGIGAVIKTRWPKVLVVGVECDEAPCLSAALAAGKPVPVKARGGFADGIAVQQIGQRTFAIASQVVDQVVLVSADQIAAAVRDVYIDTRAILEPAGAAAVAGMRKLVQETPGGAGRGETWVGIASGANVNFDRLGHIVERAEQGAGNEMLFAAEIPERPGEFLKFCDAVGHLGVTEFNYRYRDPQVARVLVGLHATHAEAARVRQSLAAAHYPVRDLGNNDLARDHLRHLIGGQGWCESAPEVLRRFWFPERPGALRDFLAKLAGRWNISLFHYRNHGASYGRVLVGFQVPDGQLRDFNQFVASTGYESVDESTNPAYQLFLQPRHGSPEQGHEAA